MGNTQYSWIPAYEEMATALLEYEDRQDELCGIVEDTIGEHYEQMDPLTFFSMFNGKRKNIDKRVEAVRTIIERFRLKADVPSDFDGLPVTNPQRWRYWDGKRSAHSGNLYQIFTYVKNKEAELARACIPHEVSGMLLYAKTDEDTQPNGVYQMSGNQISVGTLDLGLPFDGIRKQLNTIVSEHFSQEAIAA